MLDKVLKAYLERFPEDTKNLNMLSQRLADGDDMQNDRTLPGHATASAWVLSPDKSKILLVHHNFLQVWIQPGGHMDSGDENPLVAARREAHEETKVHIAKYMPLLPNNPLVPFHLGTHPIPERPERHMPGHFHHDFCYAFLAADEEVAGEMNELSKLGWYAFDSEEAAAVEPILTKLCSLNLF